MSTIGDAFEALKNVVLMQERIEGVRSDMAQTNADLRALTEKVLTLNDRVIRIETMIEFADRQRAQPPRLEP